MFAFLKTIFGGRTAAPQRAAGLATPRTVYTPTARAAPARPPAQAPRAQPKRAMTPAPQPATPVAVPDAGVTYGSDVDIPLASVLRGLPPDLKERVRDLDIRGATMTISLERILAQLPSGSVRISFGSLRQAAPQLFSIGADSDGRDVALPLDEILSRINPAMICPPQHQVARGPIEEEAIFSSDTFTPAPPAVQTPPRGSTLSVPPTPAPGETEDEVPFTRSTPPPGNSTPAEAPRTPAMRVPTPQPEKPAPEGAVLSVNLTSLAGAWPADLRSEIEQWNLPEARLALPTEAIREGLQRGRIAFTWATLRSWITPPPPAAASVHDSETVELPLPVLTPLFLAGQKPAKSRKKSAVDEIPDLFFDDRKGEIPKSNGEHEESPVQARPTNAPPKTTLAIPVAASPAPSPAAPKAAPPPQPTPAAQPAQNTGVMRIPLKDLTGMWPDALRSELANLDPSHMVALPAEAINAAMKQGKAIFLWGTLRSWIAPELPSVTSVDDKVSLELPLSVIMPLFLAGRKQPAKTRPQALDDDIPDPFAEFINPGPAAQKNGKSEAEPVSNKKAADTASVARKKKTALPKREAKTEAKTEVKTDTKIEKKVEAPAALPKQPSTPAEVLASAVKLEGVAGALVALSDGFKVASKLPPDMDGDALAAFLPHIFTKVNQATRELRMGDLNNLNFTVDNIPWKIFQVNQLFFAALGHAGQSMPTTELAALAHKLTFKN